MSSKFKQIRESYGYSQPKLAELSKVSQTYISEIENEKKQPTMPILRKLAGAYNLTLMQFIELLENDSLKVS